MAISPNFSITESIQLGVVILADTSTGSDGALTGRRIRIYTIDGNLFVAEIPWAIADASISLTILDKDYALNFVVDWDTNVSAAYSHDGIFGFTRFGRFEYGQLIRLQSSKPNIKNDPDFYNYMLQMNIEIENTVFAIDEMEDQYASQKCIERYQELITKKSIFY